MRDKELDLKLKLFKYQLLSLIEYEEKLIAINSQLLGDKKSPTYRTVEEGKYQRSKALYKNNILYLLDEESSLIVKRDTCLYAVREIMFLLQMLNNDEVKLLEKIYWYEKNYDRIADEYNYDKSTICRKKDAILKKLQRVASGK